MKSIPYSNKSIINSNSSCSLQFQKAIQQSINLEYPKLDDSFLNRCASSSRSLNSKQCQKIEQQNNKRIDDKIYHYYGKNDSSIETVKELSIKLEKLVEELNIQIEINKDIMQENERLAYKYNQLKQKVIDHFQNDEHFNADTFLNSRNMNMERLVNTQNKLNDSHQHQSPEKSIIVNKNDELELEQKFFQIKSENLALRKKLGIDESSQNLGQSSKVKRIVEQRNSSKKRNKNKFKNMNANNVLAELMNKQNLENIQNEISRYRYDKKLEVSNNNNNCSFSFLQDKKEPSQNKERSKERMNENKNQTMAKSTPLKQQENNQKNINGQSQKCFMQQNQYSFGNKSTFISSLTSEDKVDDIVNYYPKPYYAATQTGSSVHQIQDLIGHSKNYKTNQLSNLQIQFKI